MASARFSVSDACNDITVLVFCPIHESRVVSNHSYLPFTETKNTDFSGFMPDVTGLAFCPIHESRVVFNHIFLLQNQKIQIVLVLCPFKTILYLKNGLVPAFSGLKAYDNAWKRDMHSIEVGFVLEQLIYDMPPIYGDLTTDFSACPYMGKIGFLWRISPWTPKI